MIHPMNAPQMPTPKTNAMLICDYVITERNTNKKSLIGIFENIGASQFPCTHYALSVYIKLTEAQGIYDFRLELVNLSDESIVGQSKMPKPVTISNPLATHELVFNLRGVRFPKPGEYEFRIFSNDHIFGMKPFGVKEVQAPEKP